MQTTDYTTLGGVPFTSFVMSTRSDGLMFSADDVPELADMPLAFIADLDRLLTKLVDAGLSDGGRETILAHDGYFYHVGRIDVARPGIWIQIRKGRKVNPKGTLSGLFDFDLIEWGDPPAVAA